MFIFVHSHCVFYIPIRMFLFFLLIFSLFSASQSAETNFTILCLEEGNKFARSTQEMVCEKEGYKNVSGILEQKSLIQQNCAEIFMFSCNKFLDFRLCSIGIQKAKLDHDCAKEYEFDQRKTVSKCCDACKLGVKMASVENKCSTPSNTDLSFEASFHLCCRNFLNSKNLGNFVPAPTIAPPIFNATSTSTPSTPILTSSPPTEVTTAKNNIIIETTPKPLESLTTPKPPSSSTQPPEISSIGSISSTTTTSTTTVKPHLDVSRDESPLISPVNVFHPKDEVPKRIIAPIKTLATPLPLVDIEVRQLQPGERECLKSDNVTEIFESECKCPEGFKKSDSKEVICEDVDECSESSHNCKNVDSCLNTIGSFTCSECSGGLILRNTTCISEVPKSLGNSTENLIEASTFPPRQCSPGFQHNVSTDICEDINECVKNTHSCSNSSNCINTDGSYVCISSDCDSGYAFDNKTCANLDCKKGFNFDQIRQLCVEINECLNDPHICGSDSSSWCYNLHGSFECKCSIGFERDPRKNGTSCVDINECTRGLHNCWGSQTCFNSNGGFECALNGENFSEFMENIEPNMVFPPESPNVKAISPNENLFNLTCLDSECWKYKEISLAYYCVSLSSSKNEPQYRCDLKLCPEKYSLGPEGKCIPSLINFTHNATETSTSTLVSRSEIISEGNSSALNPTTMCREGFAALNGACVDVDECDPRNKFCPDGTFCINRNGSYVCIECPLGERVKLGNEDCTCNHEECSKFQGRSCQSVGAGLEKCLCSPEFFEDSNKENCHPRCPFGSSLNFTSSPKTDCACPETHKKHNGFCLKICDNLGDCDGGDCVPHEGNNICACPKGFKLDHAKEQCIDVDECRSGESRCHPEDACANFPGGYSCLNFDCDQGFTPQTGIGRCLKEGAGMAHFIRKAAIGRIMRNIKENQAFLTTKLPKAYKFEQRELKIDPKEFAKYIQVSIQSKDDKSQELVMKSIKPFPREGNVTIDVSAEASENAFTYELRTNLYVSRLPFTVDMIGHD